MTRRAYIRAAVVRRIRKQARNRCGFCLSPQSLVMARLQVEHLIPLAKGGSNDEENLWLACPLCNSHKSDKVQEKDPETNTIVALFNPRTQDWYEHFEWSKDGVHIIGKTPIGRATIIALKLNDDADAIIVRTHWVQAGWHPPKN